MTESVDSELEQALASKNWVWVRGVIEDSPEPEAAVRAADAAIAGWSPSQQRRCDLPIEVWRAVAQGTAAPAWLGLSRHLTLGSGDDLDGVDRLPHLVSLDVSEAHAWNGGLTAVAIEHLSGLRFLTLGGVDDVEHLAPLAELDLESLSLYDPQQSWLTLTDLPLPPGLRRLDIGPCDMPTLDGIERLADLRELELNLVCELTDLAPLAVLTRLRRLSIDRCKEVTDLSPLASLPELSTIFLGGLSVVDVAPLAALHRLERLDVSHQPEPRGLDAFRDHRATVRCYA